MKDEFDQGEFQGFVKTKLDAIHDDVAELKMNFVKQEERLRILENWRYWLAGGMVLGGVGSFASIAKAFL